MPELNNEDMETGKVYIVTPEELNEEFMTDAGWHSGLNQHELTQEQLNSLWNGKVLAVYDGEYTTLIRLKRYA